jgi:hypothetical protein
LNHHGIGRGRYQRLQSSFQTLLFVCFHDPLGGRNTPAVMAGLRIAVAALLAALGLLAWRRLR